MGKVWKEFKEFAFKGNVIDLAVGVMIGAAFGKIVSSFVNDMVTPLISLLTNGADFSSLYIALDGNTYATLADAQTAGAACLTYGAFLMTVLDFFIIALFVFAMVKLIARLRRPAPVEAEAPKRICPFCKQVIDDEATRCPYCTSQLNE